jgi:ferritin-like metal-binding protein YciE
MLQNIGHQNTDEARELRGLFEKQLKELYWAEGAMATMLGNATLKSTAKDLIITLEKHRIETLNHLSRLEKIFTAIGINSEPLAYKAMECLIEEAVTIAEHIKAGVVRDAAIIAILQKIKHYEIACYGTMRAYAIALREEDVVTLLEQTLEEEKQADLALSYIAESHINIEAADKEI